MYDFFFRSHPDPMWVYDLATLMSFNEIVSLQRARIPNVVIGAAWDEPNMAGLLQSGRLRSALRCRGRYRRRGAGTDRGPAQKARC